MHIINHEWNRSMFVTSAICFVWDTKPDLPTQTPPPQPSPANHHHHHNRTRYKINQKLNKPTHDHTTKWIKNQTHPHPHTDTPIETETEHFCELVVVGQLEQCLGCFDCRLLLVDHGSMDRGLERRFNHRCHRHHCMWIGAGNVDRCLWVDGDQWCLWVLTVVVLEMECWSDRERKKKKEEEEKEWENGREIRKNKNEENEQQEQKKKGRDKIIFKKKYKNIIYIKHSV